MSDESLEKLAGDLRDMGATVSVDGGAPTIHIPVRDDRRNSTDDRLRLLVERIERLEEEKGGIADDIRDVYAEAKAVGYDAKIMRKVIRLRKMKPDDRREMLTILEVYAGALGIQEVLPL